MKIYLLGQLLVQSQVYPRPNEESARRESSFSGLQKNYWSNRFERDWCIGLWNCEDKLTAEEDGTSTDSNTIEVRLSDTPNKDKLGDMFRMYNLHNPEKLLYVSSYNSFIYTPKNKIIDIAQQLEQAEIDCIIGHDGGIPLPYDCDYASPKIKEKIKNRIIVKTVEI